MPVFEDGQQNRPIHTDVPRISRESTVEILLTRAGISSLREDYCMMEYYANSAIELAATLDHYPILARCHYKRGLARFEQRRWNEASEDFLRARGCAGHYGIESKMIKKWLQKVNRGLDAQTPTTPGPFASPNPNVLSVNNTGWNSSGSLSLENEKDIYSGSPVTDSTGLSLMGDGSIPNSKSTPTGYLPGSPREGYSPPPTFCSPTKEERSQAPSPGQGSPRLDRYISDGVSTWETDHSPFKEVPAPDMSPETAARQDAIRLEIYRAKDQQAAAGRKGYAASSHPGTGGERNPPGRLRTVAFNQEIETYPAPRSFASSGGTTLFGSVTSSLRSSSLRRERVPPIDTSARVTTTTPVRLDSEDASPAMPRTPEIDDGPSSALVRSLFGKDRGGLSDGTPVTPLTAVEAGDGSQTSTSISSTPGTDEGPSSPIFRSLFGKR